MCRWRRDIAAALAATAAGFILLTSTVAWATEATRAPIAAPSSGCYIGAYVSDSLTTLAQFNADSEKRHAYFVKFVVVGKYRFDEGGGGRSVKEFVEDCAAQGAIPCLTLEPWSATEESLLSAAEAQWLDEFARDIGALDRPVFIRFGHEMNGRWYPWGWQRTTPETFIEGFRHVAGEFRAHAPKAALVWAPSQNWGSSTDETYSNWYPGDEHVDWVGLTTYQWDYAGLSGNQFVGSIVYGDGEEGNFYETFAEGHDKPMMITETACGDDDARYYDNLGWNGFANETGTYGVGLGQGAQRWWIDQVYRADSSERSVAALFPRIKAITWFSAQCAEGDFNIGGSDPAAHSAGFEAYAAAIANPYWISRPNRVPTAENDASTVLEDGTLDIPAPGVLGNDRDADGDPLSVELVTDVAHGTLTLMEDGEWEYLPSANYRGADSFAYRVSDGQAYSAAATVTIAVESVNDAPLASADFATVLEDGTFSIPAPGVLGNDHDVEGDALMAELASGPSHGTLTLSADGSVLYRPAVGYHGADAFVYRAKDGADASQLVTVSISITPKIPTVLTRLSSPGAVALAKPFVFRGRLTCSSPLAGQRIVLESSSGGKAYRQCASTATDARGDFAFVLRPAANTRYRARFAGSPTHRPTTSLSVSVKVKPAVGAPVAPATMSRRTARRVSGTLRPGHRAGSRPVRMYTYRRVSGTWRYEGYIKAKVSDKSGHSVYSAEVRLPRAGKWRLRAYAPADSRHAASWSGGYDYVTVR